MHQYACQHPEWGGGGGGRGALTIMAKRSWYLVTIAYTVRLRAKGVPFSGFKYVYNREGISQV